MSRQIQAEKRRAKEDLCRLTIGPLSSVDALLNHLTEIYGLVPYPMYVFFQHTES